MQSRFGSFVESIVGTIIGFIVAVISQLVIFPAYGVNVSLATNLKITFWFTVVSVIRAYLMRRAFNAKILHDNSRR